MAGIYRLNRTTSTSSKAPAVTSPQATQAKDVNTVAQATKMERPHTGTAVHRVQQSVKESPHPVSQPVKETPVRTNTSLSEEALAAAKVSKTTTRGRPRKNMPGKDEAPFVKSRGNQMPQATFVSKRTRRTNPSLINDSGYRLSLRPRDREILTFLYRYQILTINHLAKALGVTPDSVGKRVKQLVDHGLIEHDHKFIPRVYRVTEYGLAFAGIRETVRSDFPAVSTYQHLLLNATVGIIMEKGGPAAHQLTKGRFTDEPKVVIPERLVARATSPTYIDRKVWRDSWYPTIRTLLEHPTYPAVASNKKTDIHASLTPLGRKTYPQVERQQREAIENIWRGEGGFLHLLAHPDVHEKYGHTHRSDGAILLPHVQVATSGQFPQGVRGGSWLYEVEVTLKRSGKPTYKRVFAQQFDMVEQGLIEGVFYFVDTNSTDIIKVLKECLDELVASDKYPITKDDLWRFPIRPFMLLNGDKDPFGNFG